MSTSIYGTPTPESTVLADALRAEIRRSGSNVPDYLMSSEASYVARAEAENDFEMLAALQRHLAHPTPQNPNMYIDLGSIMRIVFVLRRHGITHIDKYITRAGIEAYAAIMRPRDGKYGNESASLIALMNPDDLDLITEIVQQRNITQWDEVLEAIQNTKLYPKPLSSGVL